MSNSVTTLYCMDNQITSFEHIPNSVIKFIQYCDNNYYNFWIKSILSWMYNNI